MEGWDADTLKVYGMALVVSEEVIMKVSHTLVEGRKFYKDKKSATETLSIFIEKGEREKVKRTTNGGYGRTTHKPLWVDVAEVVMWYVTLDRKLCKFFKYHFVRFNHFLV